MSQQHAARRSAENPSPAHAATDAAAPTSAVQLREAVARAGSFEAQEALLAPVQRKGDGEGGGVQAAAAHGISGSGGPMPFASQIQRSFGAYDVSHVQAHTDAAARQGSEAMGAEAFATGSHVAFGKSPDLHTAAHEAAHCVQQKAGVQLSGGVGKAGDRYEAHADRVADAVVAGQSAEPILAEMAGGSSADASVQRKEAEGESEISIEEAVALAASMGLDRDDILERATGTRPAADTAPTVQRKASADGVDAGWLAGIWASVKGFFASLMGSKGSGDPVEDAAIAEDRAAFRDIDGQIDVFATEQKVTTYYNDTSPSQWRAAQPDHANVLRKAAEQGISTGEVNALVGYTGPGYAPMNRMTRGQMKSNLYKGLFGLYCDQATSALGKLEDGTLKTTQRGWRAIPDGNTAIIEGLYNREFVDEAGFMSTSVNSDQGMFAGPVSMQISARTGVDIQHFSWYAREGEVLFAPGTRFKVTRFQRNADVEDAWKAWHADKNDPKREPQPSKPWFEVDLEGK